MAKPLLQFQSQNQVMDAIRKKMQSLKSETDNLIKQIERYDAATKEANEASDMCDCDIRDLSKKITGYEGEFDETNDKLIKSLESLEEKEKSYKTAEGRAYGYTHSIPPLVSPLRRRKRKSGQT